MTNLPLLQKTKDAIRYGIGVCLTPIAVLGVASVALVVFVADKFSSVTSAQNEATNTADTNPISAA